MVELHGQRDVEAATRERLRRQDLLYRPGREFRFEMFWDVALQGEQASALITRVALDLPQAGTLASPPPRDRTSRSSPD